MFVDSVTRHVSLCVCVWAGWVGAVKLMQRENDVEKRLVDGNINVIMNDMLAISLVDAYTHNILPLFVHLKFMIGEAKSVVSVSLCVVFFSLTHCCCVTVTL